MDKQQYDRLLQKSREEPFGCLLGFDTIFVGPGKAVVRMRVRSDLSNIFGATHGGAVFSLIDEAFQLACNTHGILAVALNVSITYVGAPGPDVLLEACSEEIYMTNRTASYSCRVHEVETNRLIATAQALAYRTGKPIPGNSETK
jgi:acyl-CoA thioesterase